MRNILTSIFLIFLVSTSNAQSAADFTILDIDGNSRNLYSELDNGNIVVLKFFTNWCGICNDTADEVVAIYNGYVSNSDPVVFWALDRDQNETNVQATVFRNNNNIPFPVIGEAYSIAQQFGVVYQPEYYIIRPDRSYVKRTNYSAMNTAVNDALASIATGIEDENGTQLFLQKGDLFEWSAGSTRVATLRFFDLGCRELKQVELNGNGSYRSELKNGVYLYQLEEGSEVLVKGKFAVVQP
jgi:hypothetical protein